MTALEGATGSPPFGAETPATTGNMLAEGWYSCCSPTCPKPVRAPSLQPQRLHAAAATEVQTLLSLTLLGQQALSRVICLACTAAQHESGLSCTKSKFRKVGLGLGIRG